MASLAPLHTTAGAAPSAVLFGGERDSGLLDDCWLLQLPAWVAGTGEERGAAQPEAVRWTQLRLRSGPAPRFGHALLGEWCVPSDTGLGWSVALTNSRGCMED